MKKHIVDALVAITGTSATAANAEVDRVIAAIGAAVRTHGEARIQGFGTFKKTHRAARATTNPRTGEPMRIEERNALTFKASKNFTL